MDKKQAAQFIEEAHKFVKEALVLLDMEYMERVKIRVEWTYGGKSLAIAYGYNEIKISKVWWEHLTVEQRRTTMIHEVCHLVDNFLNVTDKEWKSKGSHGHRWQELMVKAGLPPEAKFTEPTPRAVQKILRPYLVFCKYCNKGAEITKNRYTRMQNSISKGEYYQCLYCKRPLDIMRNK